MTDLKITARARAFTGRGVCSYSMLIESDGTVLVFDSVSGCYTARHIMSERTCARIRKEASEASEASAAA